MALVRAVPNVWLNNTVALELSPHTGVNTALLTPGFLHNTVCDESRLFTT